MNILYLHVKRREQFDKYKDYLKEASGKSVEEEYQAESLKALHEWK